MGFYIAGVGMIWTLGGAKLVRALLFPLFILLFMIRIPLFIYTQITFPLQLLASRVAEVLLTLIGIPVLRDGNILELPSQKLSVVEACSGIRSLMSLSMLSLVYGYLFDSKPWMRWVLLALAAPIAIAANALRVTVTGIMSEVDTELATGIYHSLEGFIMWGAAVSALLLAHLAVNAIYRYWSGRVAGTKGQDRRDGGGHSMTIFSSLHAKVLTGVLLAQAAVFYGMSANDYVPTIAPLETMPRQAGDWTMISESKPEKEIQDLLKADAALTRTFQRSSDTVSLFVAFFKSQRAGVVPHSPRVCLPGAGWTPSGNSYVDVKVPGRAQPININRFVVARGENKSIGLLLVPVATPCRGERDPCQGVSGAGFAPLPAQRYLDRARDCGGGPARRSVCRPDRPRFHSESIPDRYRSPAVVRWRRNLQAHELVRLIALEGVARIHHQLGLFENTRIRKLRMVGDDDHAIGLRNAG
jgi:exosortase